MNIDIERLKVDRAYWDTVAPEGAEIYRGIGLFSKWLNGAEMVSEEDGEWVASIASWPKEFYAKDNDCIPRPEPATEWDGEGLPPVGCECEVNLYGWWVVATILAYGKSKFLYEIAEGQIDQDGDPLCGEHGGFIMQAKFRPIRTKAERDRDDLAEALNSVPNDATLADIKSMAEAAIKLGWSKD